MLISILVVLIIDIALEVLAIPLLYESVPLPFPSGAKPIGGAFFVATFFHLILIVASIIAIIIIASRLGIVIEGLLPKSKSGWLDIMFLVILVVSGFISWFNPFAILFFIISGIYLVATEIE
jgi:hypothetical protein